MNIKLEVSLSENYRITSDTYNIILQKEEIIQSGENKGKSIWRNLSFYPNVIHAAEGIIDKEIFSSNATNFNELIAEVKEAKEVIAKAVKDYKLDLSPYEDKTKDEKEVKKVDKKADKKVAKKPNKKSVKKTAKRKTKKAGGK